MNGRYRVTVLAVELYDPLLIQRAIARAGGDGARTGATLAIEVPGGFRPAIVASFGSRAEATRLLASLAIDGIEANIVDDGHPLWNRLRRAWLRLEGRDRTAKTTAPEQRLPDQPIDPLAPPGSEPDRVNFKLHRNADRTDINPVDAVFGELRVHLVRLAGLIVVILLFALPWYFMLGRVSSSENLKGAGGGEEVFRLSGGSGADLPKGALQDGSGSGSGSGGDPQREAEQMAAGAGSGDDGKSGPTRGQGAGGPGPIDEPTEAGGGNGPGGGKGGAPGSGGDPDAANDQLKRTALLLTIAGLLGLVAGLVAGWLSFSRGKPGLRVVKSTWFWVAAAVLVGGLALGHFATRQAELKKVAATVQHEGSGSGSSDSSGSGSGAALGSGSGEGSGSGSGSGATAPRSADAPKSIASQVASMQGPPKSNLAELLRTLREKQAAPAKAQGRKGASKTDRPAPGSAAAPSAAGDASASAGEPPSGPATGQNRAARGSAATPAASAPPAPANSPAKAAAGPSGKGSSDGTGSRRSAPAQRPATTPSEAAAGTPTDAPAEPGTAGNAAPGNAPAAGAKQSPVESKVAAMGEPPCEALRSPYKAMLCKLRKERDAAAKAAEEAAAAKPGADPNRPGADKPGADKSAPGQPGGGKSKKGNQPPANSQQPPKSPNLVAGVGFSVGLLLGLLFSLFYYRFYRR